MSELSDISILFHKKDELWLTWLSYEFKSRGYTVTTYDVTQGEVKNICEWVLFNSTDQHVAIILESEEMYASNSFVQEWEEKIVDVLKDHQVMLIRRKGLQAPQLKSTIQCTFIGEPEGIVKDQLLEAINELNFRSISRKELIESNTIQEPIYPGKIPRNWLMPYSALFDFFGRRNEYSMLENDVGKIHALVLTSKVGGRGLGLTAIMTYYIYENLDRYSTIWWIDAADELLMATHLRDLAARFCIQVPLGNFSDMWSKIYPAMANKARLPFLIILNRPTEQIMESFEAVATKAWKSGTVLSIGTKQKKDKITEMKFGPMDKQDSCQLLQALSGVDGEFEMEEIADYLKHHPLLMRMAAMIIKNGKSAESFIEDFKLEGQLIKVSDSALKPFMINTRFLFDQLSDAERLLNFGAYFEALPIPVCMLEPSPQDNLVLASIFKDPVRLEEILQTLTNYGVIIRAKETFMLHPLIARCITQMENIEKDWPKIISYKMSEVLSKKQSPKVLEERGREIYPHALHLCLKAVRDDCVNEHLIVLINNVANQARALQNFSVACELLKGLIHYYEGQLNEDSEELSGLFVNLGMVYKLQNNLHDALSMFEKALKIDEKRFGREHENIADDLVQIARILTMQKSYAMASTHFEEAVRILNNQLGEGHPKLARVLSDYIVVLKETNNTTKMYDYAKMIVDIERKTFGIISPKLCNSLATLGFAAAAHGNNSEAVQYLNESMELEKKIYGINHPKIAVRLGQLANLMERMGDRVNAAQRYSAALGIFKSTIGADHASSKLIAQCLQRVAS